eukprot:8165524-Heterocapsa_arctica.AAC.1
MDNQELFSLLEFDDRLMMVAGEIHSKTLSTPTPPTRPPPKENIAIQPELLPHHLCMKCSAAVGHRDRFGRKRSEYTRIGSDNMRTSQLPGKRGDKTMKPPSGQLSENTKRSSRNT